jgi:hypothetical protein
MPQAPIVPQDQQMQQAIDPKNFLVAAADLAQNGQLSSPVPAGTPLQTGKARRDKLKVLK